MKFSRECASAGISGFESPANEYVDIALSLDELLIQRNSATFIGQARGDSMTGYGIFNGDLLIVDRAAPTTEFDVVVATLNGEFVCKAIDRKSHALVSSGLERKEYVLTHNDEYQEEGVVVSSIRLHRKLSREKLCSP